MNKLAKNLGRLLESRELSQSELASASGVSQGQISRILSGEGKPRGGTLEKLARVLGVSASTLRGGATSVAPGPSVRRAHAHSAVRQIARDGFTDVLPEPIERRLFVDCEEEIVHELLRLDSLFTPDAGAVNPRIAQPSVVRVAGPKERHGLRWVSQTDPLYDAYGLTLLHEVAPDIEANRIPIEQDVVHSYRWVADDSGPWRPGGMRDFLKTSRDRSEDVGWVVTTDIASFYDRIPLTQIDRLLNEVCRNTDACRRLLRIFEGYAGDNQVGLPIGGPAARLLAELFLSRVDQRLDAMGIQFTRYVDDYRLFATSESEAYRWLVALSDALHAAGALTLQSSKTKIQDSGAYVKTQAHQFHDDTRFDDDDSAAFDMYGLPSAQQGEMLDWDEDEATRYFEDALANDDSRARRALGRLPWLNNDSGGLDAAVRIVVERISRPEMRMLAPHAFRRVATEVKRLSEDQRGRLVAHIWNLVNADSPVLLPEQTAIYTIDLLAKAHSPSSLRAIRALSKEPKSDLLHSHATVALARMKQSPWLELRVDRYESCGPWERRALIAASQETRRGDVWRDATRSRFDALESLVDTWASSHWEPMAM